jgi:hypothetical protein
MPPSLITDTDIVSQLGGSPSLEGIHQAALSEPRSRHALCAFLTLTQSPQRFVQAGWSAESIFWSRYFWFRRFLAIRGSVIGADAGLEQQEFKILENPFPPCAPDWSMLSEVQREADAT